MKSTNAGMYIVLAEKEEADRFGVPLPGASGDV
jgi:hypothetical protein